MKLPQPVSVTLPGTKITKLISELPVTIIDSSSLKRVQVQLRPFMKPLTLWEGETYAAIGDYTQAQVENKILELLGDNPADTLISLYVEVPHK